MPGPVLTAKEAVAEKTLCMALVLEGLSLVEEPGSDTPQCDHCNLRGDGSVSGGGAQMREI